MTMIGHQPFVLVVVSPDAETRAAELETDIGDKLRSATGQRAQARVLGPSAVEFALDALDSVGVEAVSALVRGLEAHMDVALLPAQGRRKRLLVSDMDATIIGQECLDELADFAGVKAQVSAITEAAMRGELDFEAALRTRVALLSGMKVAVLEHCWQERITLNPGARTLVATMAAHGARCVLVSGGFTFFTQRVAEAAGFHAHRGNTLMERDGALTGEVGVPILGRAAKRETLEGEAGALGLEPADALALGDGANDLDMIRAAGLGVAYRAKPVVAAQAAAAIRLTDLTSVLYFQGYVREEFVTA
jgi:phosphoserine phosphatase